VITPDKIKNLADLPSREVLVATVLGTMQAPITSFVRVLNANITGLARALDQIREQKAS
jgi:large subunit ribosomal protein L10